MLAEAKMWCSGQPVVLVGDLNADPLVIPSLANWMADRAWIDVELAFADGRGVAPPPTCQFRLDEGKGTRRDFAIACAIALAAATTCQVLPDRWFSPHFAVRTGFSSAAWDATVDMAKVYSPLWLARWIPCHDRFRRSSSGAVQNIWDAYIQELSCVPVRVRELLRAACDADDVDASWQIWSSEAEASLIRVYHSAAVFTCLGSAGGRFQDRIYRTDHTDEFDGSSLTLHLPRFRRGLKSVFQVLKRIRANGFSDTRVTALWDRWSAVSHMGPVGPFTSFELDPPRRPWVLQVGPGRLLSQIRHSSRSLWAGIQAWSNWIRQNPSSHSCKWLRPDFVPPAPYLVCKPADSPDGSGFWFSLRSLTLIFVKYGRHTSGVRVILWLLLRLFWTSLEIISTWKLPSKCPFSQVKNFMMQQWPRNPQLVALMGGPGMRLRHFPYLGL